MELLTLVTIVHLVVAFLLICLVLIQDSKGGAMGILGGGGSSETLFGTGGATSFLVKVTRWTAVVFAGTCITLAYLSTRSHRSVTDDFVPAATAPVEGVAPEMGGADSAAGDAAAGASGEAGAESANQATPPNEGAKEEPKKASKEGASPPGN